MVKRKEVQESHRMPTNRFFFEREHFPFKTVRVIMVSNHLNGKIYVSLCVCVSNMGMCLTYNMIHVIYEVRLNVHFSSI